jgi:hypothetical protein
LKPEIDQWPIYLGAEEEEEEVTSGPPLNINRIHRFGRGGGGISFSKNRKILVYKFSYKKYKKNSHSLNLILK